MGEVHLARHLFSPSDDKYAQKNSAIVAPIVSFRLQRGDKFDEIAIVILDKTEANTRIGIAT